MRRYTIKAIFAGVVGSGIGMMGMGIAIMFTRFIRGIAGLDDTATFMLWVALFLGSTFSLLTLLARSGLILRLFCALIGRDRSDTNA